MHKKYIIEGDLAKFAKIFEERKRIWDATAEFRTRIAIELEKQHGNTMLFSGPLHVHGTFYLGYSKDIAKPKRKNAALHIQRPTISSLLYFLENVATGIIFNNGSLISAISCSKVLTTDHPRVEIEITSLKNNSISPS